jgi:hypothetical protein
MAASESMQLRQLLHSRRLGKAVGQPIRNAYLADHGQQDRQIRRSDISARKVAGTGPCATGISQ